MARQSISLDEFKDLSKELKTLIPIKKTIASFLGQKWEIVEEKLGDKVNAEQLKKFSVS